MLRQKFLALAIAVGTFGVVTGGIVGVGLVTAEPADAQIVVQNLTGEWTGGYISSVGADVNTFDIKMSQRGQALSGTITETNSFGDTSQALFLTSTLAGSFVGNEVKFVKTYDGSGGESHSVTYQGRMDRTGRRVRGTFNAEGNTGTFEMVR